MIKPINDNIILKRKIKNNTTKTGIIISNKKENEDYAIVVAVNKSYIDNGKEVTIPLVVGDEVIYKNYSSTDIKYQNEEYIIVSYKDILAIIR
ncbi:MAG: co-chaperone GroES [Mycoplasma sp.]|nr:co-chaperone GroES [Mycoplasma sp.]